MLWVRQALAFCCEQGSHSAWSLGAYLHVGEALASHKLGGHDRVYKKTIGDGVGFLQRNSLTHLLEVAYIN